jgi:hypothetical protein
MRAPIYFALVLTSALGCTSALPEAAVNEGGNEVSTDTNLQEQIAIVYDDKAPGETKLVAADAVVDGGKAAIPLLVERLGRGENPIFLDQMKVPTGPMHAGPPTVLPVTIKFQIESMLYRIIAPDDQMPTGESASAPGDLGALIDSSLLDASRPPLAFVEDWSAWWNTHQHESLDEMRAWAKAEVDRLWDEIHAQTTAPPR